MDRVRGRKVLSAGAAVVALAVGGYVLVADGDEPTQRASRPPAGVETPISSPVPSAAQPSPPEETGTEEPSEPEGSPNVATTTPSPVPTHSLCPFLPSGNDPGSPQDLADESAAVAIDRIPVLTVFAAAAQAAGFDTQLRTASGLTILAPTDDAFAADIPEDELEILMVRRHGDLKKLLRSHTIGQDRTLAGLVGAGGVSSLSGERVTFAANGEAVRISDDANVICSDLAARNATIHVIDSVLGRIQLTEPQEEFG